jgi:transcriptional regulator with XRE-family HTH domain
MKPKVKKNLPYDSVWAKWLRAKRGDTSLRDMAKGVKIPYSQLCRMESGKAYINERHLNKILNYFHVSLVTFSAEIFELQHKK